MHKRPKLPSLGPQGSPSSASAQGPVVHRGGAEDDDRRSGKTFGPRGGSLQEGESHNHKVHHRGCSSMIEPRTHRDHPSANADDGRGTSGRSRGYQPGTPPNASGPAGHSRNFDSSNGNVDSASAAAGKEVLPSLAAAPRAKALPGETSCENSRQPSPVRSTAAPSSSSRRSSSSSYQDGQSTSCPAPPPEVAALSLGQPARSRALHSRTGSRTPDPSRNRYSDDYGEHGGRAPSGSRTPELARSAGGGHALAHKSLESAASDLGRIDNVLPLCRAGWSGQLDGDQVLDLSRDGVDVVQPLTPHSPYKMRKHADDDEFPIPATGSRALPPLQKPGGKSPEPVSPANPNTPRSSKRRPHRLPTGDRGQEKEPTSPTTKGKRKPGFGTEDVGSVPPNTVPEEQARAMAGLSHLKGDASSGNSSSASLNSCSSSKGLNLRMSKSASRGPRHSLNKGSRDDSFLSTISESTRSSDSTSTDEKQQRDSKITVLDGSQIEVFSETTEKEGRGQVDIVKDFRSLFKREGDANAEELQQLLRQYGFDKPLEMQRRVMPLVMSAFRDEQKSFITVQGAPQCGKTSALVFGMLGAVDAEMPGIRAVVLSTSSTRDFKKYFEICAEAHPLRLECFEGINRKVSFEGLPPDPDSAMAGVDPLEDLQRLSSALSSSAPAMVFGHPSRVLPLLREAPSWGVDLSNVQVLALDDAEETICMGLMDEVCEVCTILRHFSKVRLRHIILSHFLSHEAKSMIRCLRNSLLRQQNLFGIRAHRTQARAKSVNHYYAVAPRPRWPAMLAALHHALSLPSGIIFDDASCDARAQARVALRALGVTASVWNALQEQGSGARAAARDGAASAPRGPAFHLMPSDLVVLKVDLPQVRCVLHFEVPRRELSVYGLRLMCLEQQDQKKVTRKGGPGGRSLSVLFVEEEEIVRELEKTFHIRMQEVPTEMLVNG